MPKQFMPAWLGPVRRQTGVAVINHFVPTGLVDYGWLFFFYRYVAPTGQGLKDLAGRISGNESYWQFTLLYALRANEIIVVAGLIYNTLCPTGNRRNPIKFNIL